MHSAATSPIIQSLRGPASAAASRLHYLTRRSFRLPGPYGLMSAQQWAGTRTDDSGGDEQERVLLSVTKTSGNSGFFVFLLSPVPFDIFIVPSFSFNALESPQLTRFFFAAVMRVCPLLFPFTPPPSLPPFLPLSYS